MTTNTDRAQHDASAQGAVVIATVVIEPGKATGDAIARMVDGKS